MRHPNTQCLYCQNPIYRRPKELQKGRVFCSRECCVKYDGPIDHRDCNYCGKSYKPRNRKSSFCSRSCANTSRLGNKYTKDSHNNLSTKRLALLKEIFNFDSCMIIGCSYNNCYDVHRLEQGKDGGKYEIGNMFAICPNHHAEIHRGIIEVRKVSDCELEIIRKIGT